MFRVFLPLFAAFWAFLVIMSPQPAINEICLAPSSSVQCGPEKGAKVVYVDYKIKSGKLVKGKQKGVLKETVVSSREEFYAWVKQYRSVVVMPWELNHKGGFRFLNKWLWHSMPLYKRTQNGENTSVLLEVVWSKKEKKPAVKKVYDPAGKRIYPFRDKEYLIYLNAKIEEGGEILEGEYLESAVSAAALTEKVKGLFREEKCAQIVVENFRLDRRGKIKFLDKVICLDTYEYERGWVSEKEAREVAPEVFANKTEKSKIFLDSKNKPIGKLKFKQDIESLIKLKYPQLLFLYNESQKKYVRLVIKKNPFTEEPQLVEAYDELGRKVFPKYAIYAGARINGFNQREGGIFIEGYASRMAFNNQIKEIIKKYKLVVVDEYLLDREGNLKFLDKTIKGKQRILQKGWVLKEEVKKQLGTLKREGLAALFNERQHDKWRFNKEINEEWLKENGFEALVELYRESLNNKVLMVVVWDEKKQEPVAARIYDKTAHLIHAVENVAIVTGEKKKSGDSLENPILSKLNEQDGRETKHLLMLFALDGTASILDFLYDVSFEKVYSIAKEHLGDLVFTSEKEQFSDLLQLITTIFILQDILVNQKLNWINSIKITNRKSTNGLGPKYDAGITMIAEKLMRVLLPYLTAEPTRINAIKEKIENSEQSLLLEDCLNKIIANWTAFYATESAL